MRKKDRNGPGMVTLLSACGAGALCSGFCCAESLLCGSCAESGTFGTGAHVAVFTPRKKQEQIKSERTSGYFTSHPAQPGHSRGCTQGGRLGSLLLPANISN